MSAGWLVVISAVGVWVLLGLLNLIFNCIDFVHAARRREEAEAMRGAGS